MVLFPLRTPPHTRRPPHFASYTSAPLSVFSLLGFNLPFTPFVPSQVAGLLLSPVEQLFWLTRAHENRSPCFSSFPLRSVFDACGANWNAFSGSRPIRVIVFSVFFGAPYSYPPCFPPMNYHSSSILLRSALSHFLRGVHSSRDWLFPGSRVLDFPNGVSYPGFDANPSFPIFMFCGRCSSPVLTRLTHCVESTRSIVLPFWTTHRHVMPKYFDSGASFFHVVLSAPESQMRMFS